MRIIWSPTSRKKIEELVDFIAADNLDAALALVEEIESRVQNLKNHPSSGRILPVLNDEMVRELIIRGNYLVVYEIQGGRIEILTIRHAKQYFDDSDLDTD